jgi:hypothetical protein
MQSNPQEGKTDQRGAARFPVVREIRYKILSRRRVDESGFGTTINMSSSGVLFTADRDLRPGMRLEVSISWPVALNGQVPLKLVARGRVVRSAQGVAAIEISQHEFRTQASPGPTVVQ